MIVSDYLNRIQYTGSLTPNYQLLQQLQKNHVLHIPFENLDIHYHIPIQLELHHLFQKIILRKRGGFCYELNALFYHLLTQLGYQTSLISGRVFNKETHNYGMEFDHLALVVELDDQNYLVDVGFSEFAFYPLQIQPGFIQHDPRGDFKFDKLDDHYWLVSKITDEVPVPQYMFTLKKRELAQFEPMCNYHQTSPQSHFTQKKFITRATLNGRITIIDHTLKIMEQTKPPVQKNFENHEFATYVQTWFNIAGLP